MVWRPALGAEGTLAGPPGGQRTLVLPIDTTFDNLLLDDGSVFGLGVIPVQVHVTGTVHAQSIDGPHPCPTFEDGTLEGWQGYGAVSVVDATFGTGPAEGNFQALLTTGAGAISAAEIDALLGGDGLLAAFDFFDAVEGSVLFGSFELAESGGVLTFDWNFLTDEAPSASFNDTAFVLVDIGLDAWLPPLLLADTNGTFVLSLTDFVKETGYNSSASLPFVFDRRIRVAFVVLDRGDDEVDSALLIDNICLPALVPEPSSLVLALPALGVIARRRSKAAARKRARRPAQ